MKIKRLLAMLLCLAMVCGFSPAAFAEGEVEVTAETEAAVAEPVAETNEITASGECGDKLTWMLSDDGVLTISGTGDMANYTRGKSPWYGQAEEILRVTIQEGVTSIGDYAFSNCSSLTSITIPESVTSIGFGAFEECESLKSVTIPASVTNIGTNAFANCGSLTAIDVEDKNPAYSSLNGVLFNKDRTDLLAYPCGKSGDYAIPEGVMNIGACAFWNCGNLTAVTIPEGVETIGYWAFRGAVGAGLESVTIPRTVKMIGPGAFANEINKFDKAVLSIVFKGTAPQIGESAFEEVIVMAVYPADDPSWNEEIMLDYGGESRWIGSKGDVTDETVVASGKCGEELNWSLTFGGALTISGAGEMDEWHDYTSDIPWSKYRQFIRSAVLEEGVASISNGAFYECQYLSSIRIPSTVTKIGGSAFFACYRLESIVIPEGVTTIEGMTFGLCVRLKSLIIPKSVTKIEFDAFSRAFMYYEVEYRPDIYYRGTLLEWEKIIDEGLGLSNIRLHTVEPVAVSGELGETEYNTPEKIEEALTEALSEAGFEENFAAVDARVLVMDENGELVDATPETFPEEGVKVLLPYPEGTDASLDFMVAHMLTSGERAGEIEYLTPEKTDGGLLVTVSSLSPFAVAARAAYTIGDVDGDGIADSWDASLILRYEAGLIDGTGLKLAAADVDGNGIADSWDASLILRYEAGLIESFPKAA